MGTEAGTKERKPRESKKVTLNYIARENMREVIDEANELGLQPKDIIGIVVKNGTYNLVYSE